MARILEETVPYSPGMMDERTTSILDTAIFQYIARQLWEVRQMLEAERSEGKLAPETIDVTETGEEYDAKKVLGVEFFTADLFNDGPNTVYIRVNQRQAKQVTLNNGESLTLDFTKSKRKIHWLYFRCDTGETASVRVVGKY